MLKGNSKGVLAENMREMKHKGLSEREAVMVSMKNAKPKTKKTSSMDEGPSAPEADYPYNARMDFDHEMLDKLGMKKMPAHGSEVMMHAKGKVHSLSEDTQSDGKKRRRMTVQLTHLGLSNKY